MIFFANYFRVLKKKPILLFLCQKIYSFAKENNESKYKYLWLQKELNAL